jgi:hypothetical protein
MLFMGVVAGILLWRGLISDQLILSKMEMDGAAAYHNFSYLQEGLSHGEIRTWNPYIYSGAPVLESFQYSLQYPVRWLLAPLPTPLAMNWMVFLHLWLAGVTMYCWVWFRTKFAPGAFAAGVIFMLCGPIMARVTAAHFNTVYTVAWMPLVFLGIDGWCKEHRKRWLLLSAAAAALQILAGFPQYFYFTALLAGLYSFWTLVTNEEKIKTAVGLLAIYPLAAMIGAVVLVPGYLVSQEAVRAGGVPAAWAASASMQFKDLLLMFAPGVFGGISDQSYWDNEHIHEMWVYSGLGGLLLACTGWSRLPIAEKMRFAFLMMLVIILALGAYTPLFTVMRKYIPMYSSFRTMGRWTVCISLFIALLAGTGLEKIASVEKIPRGAAWSFLGMGAVFLVIGLLLYGDSLNGWYRNWADILTFKPYYRQNLPFMDRQLVAQGHSANALCWSGCLAMALALAFLLIKNRKLLTGLLITAIVADLMIFASPLVTYFNKSDVAHPELAAAAKNFPAGSRNINFVNRSANISLKLEGVWGNDPVIFKRYVELIASSQGFALDKLVADVPIHRNTPVFKLLRGRYAFVPTRDGIKVAELQRDVLPRFLVVGNYKVIKERDAVLGTLLRPDFDFRREIILETQPELPPSHASAPDYKVNVLSSTASRWVVEVETSAPGILLMTDSYAKGWRARALPGSAQQNYDLQPADWAVRGIPLTVAGKHLLEIKYTPPGFALGLGVTLATLAVLAVFAVRALRAGGISHLFFCKDAHARKQNASNLQIS